MKNMRKIFKGSLFVGLAFLIVSCGGAVGVMKPVGVSATTYTLTFTSYWTSSNFPTNFPNNAHFTRLVGAVHNDNVSLWSPGTLASRGLQDMAEVGGTDQFIAQVRNDGGSNVGALLLGEASQTGGSVGSSNPTKMSITVDQNFPLVTLVSMVGPSPDWFVGVHDLVLQDSSGAWVDSIEVPLEVYDAGTDSGLQFYSTNVPTNPHRVVQLLTTDAADTDFVSGISRNASNAQRYIAKFTFQRK